jgi:glycosyltransferase involved in cell wall biosynthesis
MKRDGTMKLLFIGYYSPFVCAGTARIHDFAQVLLEKEKEVFVVSPITVRKKARWVDSSNGVYVIRFFAFSPLKAPFVGGLFNVLSAFFSSFLMCLLKRPDVVIASVPPGEPSLGAFLVSRIFGMPVVFDARDEWEDYRINNEVALPRLWYIIMKKVYNGVYKGGRFCVAVNEMVVDHLVRRGIERVHLLPHSLDISLFMPRDRTKTRIELGLDPADFIAVYAGIFQDYYRIDIVIKALHKLVFEKGIKNLKLLIVGSGPKMKEYIRIVEELKLSDNVCFVGLKPRERVAEFLGCSDVGVIPYDDNPLWVYPLPTKFHEYCSCGLPVIASVFEEAILARYIKKWKVGLVIKPLSVDKMVDAIEFLYYHREKAKEMGVNGRKIALTHFDREKIASNFLKLIMTALSEKK